MTIPYFFDEADIASNGKQPGDREKALNLSLNDLKWLNVVHLRTRSERETSHTPMFAERVVLTLAGVDIVLAGAFAMSRPDTGEVTLYTPWKGLIKFADMDDLHTAMDEWLEQASGKRELLRYLSIEQRDAVLAAPSVVVTAQAIEGAVFDDQALIIEANRARNAQAMTVELLRMPTLRTMLVEVLNQVLAERFPRLDQGQTRMEALMTASDDAHYRANASSVTLSDALLQHYLTSQWPNADTATLVFSNPRHALSTSADNLAWRSAIIKISQSFTPRLRSLLKTFWNTAISNGMSRSAFIAQCMSDAFDVDLLLKRQQGILTTPEYLRLKTIGLAGTAALPTQRNPVHVEKVRVSGLYKATAQLASTLMIGNNNTLGYLYTPSRGIEVTHDMAALRNLVWNMFKSEGHEDTLLNFLSLDERGAFLSLQPNERIISGEPIIGPVFEQLMDDIQDKQLQNLSYALDRFRESQGNLDVDALVDKALDIRGLIDERLLSTAAQGRWSTQADQRWNAQPATVRAEAAKKQLALLSTVEDALSQRIEQLPMIPSSASTAALVQSVIVGSLTALQSMFTHTLSTALRSELTLHSVARTLDVRAQEIIKTVLDSPVRVQRSALNGFLPDVFSLALHASNSSNLLELASCFVMTERGGLDPWHSGKTIVWTPARGFESFSSLTPLLTELGRRLGNHDERPALLENLAGSEYRPALAFTLAPLKLLTGHFLDHLQKPFVQLDQTHVIDALSSPMPTTLLSSLLSLVALRKPEAGLNHASAIAQSLITQQMLPAWLAKASVEDQVLQAELLQQYLNNVSDDKDYLSGIQPLQRTAHDELHKRLKADGYDVDPDHIQIKTSPKLMSGTFSLTLTEFALGQLQDIDIVPIKLQTLNETPIPQGMDESYVKTLVRSVNIGQLQQAVLDSALADTSVGIADRKYTFSCQLPWQILHYAHTEKLQERLSESAFDLIRQIMNMPDAVAREAVDGANAIIRPLEFIGIPGLATIKVPGMYLIGATPYNEGPQVLIAPYSPKHGIREYKNPEQLLTEMKTRSELHDWVLMNLPQPARIQVENRMATTNDRLPAVSLGSTPIRGNVLTHLFKDNVALLARLLGTQTDVKSAREWASIKHVLGEDLHEAYSLCMGKLAYPMTVWRSYREIKHSADDLQSHKWAQAVTAFVSGIAQLASLRQSMGGPPSLSTDTSEAAKEVTKSRFKWQDVDITAPRRTELQTCEQPDVDLSSMTLNPAIGLFTHPDTKKLYAPVEGKVYPLRKEGDRWRIADNSSTGPHVEQSTSKQWRIDPPMPAPRYSMINRLKISIAVNGGMNVEAKGLPEIRSLFPVKARLIDEALDLATTYAWNSFRNLQLLKDPGSKITPVHQLLMDFIGVQNLSPEHVQMLEKAVEEVFAGLLDPTLRHANSKRFVVGRALQYGETTFAFTVPGDKRGKIYLADKFFLPLIDHYRNYMTDPAFPINTHARATTLIHEITHIVSSTEDIDYLDSGRPYTDLIETFSAHAKALKNELVTVQTTGLSHFTPLERLFCMHNPVADVWEDFGETTYENTDRVAERVLQLTGQSTLDDARTHFMSNSTARFAVQLANADSLTLLITRLGRRLHVVTP
ncbi:hypothetical protein ACQR3P_03075 [Rhodococcus sp. IEGM1300]